MSIRQTKAKNQVNVRVIIYSLLALGFVAVSFLVDWLFLIGALILVVLNQRELMGKK
jgi:1,4-dihydroxy-2-naphthoate octaprenyltransferase